MKKVLLIGFGNPGRLDDGVGPALAEKVETLNLKGVEVDSNYQLSVEDSYKISQNDVVIFADADVQSDVPFYLKKIEPSKSISFSSHSISPQSLLALTEQLFGKKSEAYLLGIRGYEFDEFGERLSERAKENLSEAFEFIKNALMQRDFKETINQS